MEGSEILSLEVIEASLSTKIIGRAQRLDNLSNVNGDSSDLSKNELWDEIDSTNTRAAALAAQGCAEGVMVIARQQTAGRGRLGRAWISPPDAGISFSVVLRPKIELSRLPLITLATGVAVAQAIEASVGVRPGSPLCWPQTWWSDARSALLSVLASMSDRKPMSYQTS
jgi:hypothetical protein